MKTLFWLLLGASVGGFVYTFLWASPPRIPNVGGGQLNDWYSGLVAWGAIAGAIIGCAGALMNRWTSLELRHKPGEAGAEFQNRVALRGVLLMLFAGLIVAPLLVGIGGFFARFVPLPQMDRMVELLFALKTLSVVTAATVTAGILYSLTTRFLRWGGQYALLPKVS